MKEEPRKVQENKEILKKLLIEKNLKEAKTLLEKFQEEKSTKFKENWFINYWDFEHVIEYSEKEKNQWLRDLLDSQYIDDTTEKIIKTALYDGYQKALDEIEDAIPYSPTNSSLYSIKAIIYFYLGNIAKYFEFQESEEQNKLFELEEKVSDLVETQGKYSQALEIIEKHLKVYPKDHLMLAYKGEALLKQGDIGESVASLKKSISNKRTHYALSNLLEISRNNGDYVGAYNYANQLIEVLEEEFSREKKITKKEGKVSLLDLWTPLSIGNAKFAKAEILNQLNRVEEAKVALRELQNYLDNIISPLLSKSMEDDGDYYADLYMANTDTPGTALNNLYEKVQFLYYKIEPNAISQPQEKKSNVLWYILGILIIILLIIIF